VSASRGEKKISVEEKTSGERQHLEGSGCKVWGAVRVWQLTKEGGLAVLNRMSVNQGGD